MFHARTVTTALLLAFTWLAQPAHAGDPERAGGKPGDAAAQARDVDWLTAYRFHLSAASLRTDDPRFSWDAHFGGDVDLVDYRFGRINMVADYGVIVGSQFRTIDPNQGAYHLNLSASVRSRLGRWDGEFQALFDHVSRHLSDRSNRTGISWNAAGAVGTARRQQGSLRTTFTAGAAKIVQSAFVDYAWQIGAGVDAEYSLSPRTAVVARGEVQPMLVEHGIAGRDTQVAAKGEGGVRLYGWGAGVELFAAWERRLDPYPLEYATRSWALIGFRLLSR